MGPGHLRGPDNLLPGGPGLTVGDILVNAAGEEVHVLLHHAHIAAQAFQRHVSDILSVQQNLPFRGVIETRDQVAQRGLSASGRAH